MSHKNRRILMLLENAGFPDDCRVAREADALVEAGYSVRIICPTDEYTSRRYELVAGVHTYRYPRPPEWGGVIGYLVEYGYSLTMAMLYSAYIFVRHGFDTLHVHCPPDMYVLIGYMYRVFGVHYVMDHHDLSPELYQAQTGGGNPLVLRILRWFERRSCRLAKQIITTNRTQQQTNVERSGIDIEKTNVVRNGPDLNAIGDLADIEPIARFATMDCTVIGYMGCTGFQDGVDDFLYTLRCLIDELDRQDFYAIIIGDGPALASLRELSAELRLQDHLEFVGYQTGDAFHSHLASCDIMVTPDPPNPYNQSCTMIKTLDYMAMSLPIVGYDMPEHRESAGDASLYADGNDRQGFARCLVQLLDSSELRASMGRIGRQRIETRFAWQHQKKPLLETYEKVFLGKNGP